MSKHCLLQEFKNAEKASKVRHYPVGLVAKHCPKVANDVDDAKDKSSLPARQARVSCMHCTKR